MEHQERWIARGDDAGKTEDEEVEVERVWRAVRSRLHEALGTRSELAAALGAYAADSQNHIRLAEVRAIRDEYGASRDPSAEALLPLLHVGEGADDAPVA